MKKSEIVEVGKKEPFPRSLTGLRLFGIITYYLTRFIFRNVTERITADRRQSYTNKAVAVVGFRATTRTQCAEYPAGKRWDTVSSAGTSSSP